MKQLLKAVLVAVVLVLVVNVCLFTSCTIPSTGMENSLFRGERVIVNKWSYGFRLPLMQWTGYVRWAERTVQEADIVLFNNPAGKGTVSQREVFINRCIGMPGDTLMLYKELIQTQDKVFSPDSKLVYAYPGDKEEIVKQALAEAGINENKLVGYDRGNFLRSFSHYEIYLLKQELQGKVTFRSLQTDTSDGVHPFVIPAKGKTLKIYPWNAKLLCNTIIRHEGRKAMLKGDTLWVDGHRTTSYTFTKDYHWVASNNSVSMCDSRLFGFVPKDHIIGKASLIWFSKDPEQPLWKGFRWKRFFRLVQ